MENEEKCLVEACEFKDCPNPILIDRYIEKDESLEEGEVKLIEYWFTECKACHDYFANNPKVKAYLKN